MCEDIPCVKACPTGALDPQLTDINRARMGLAVLVDHETCLNFLGLRCDVCYASAPRTSLPSLPVSAIAANRKLMTHGLQCALLKRPFNCLDAKESFMKQTVTILLATLGLILSQPALAQQGASRVQTLRGADAAATDQAPPERPYTGKSPGSQKLVGRTFRTQPPVIPHAIEGFDAVTLQSNPCVACHGPDNYKNAKAPKLANSHFKDRDGITLSEVSPAWYQCTACHVPQADAKPLVGNTFLGDTGTAAKKKK